MKHTYVNWEMGFRKALLIVLFFTLGLAKLLSLDIAGISIPDSRQVGGETLRINGAGIRSKLFFKVYVGTLYVKSPSRDAEKIITSDEPMAIRLDFLMNVDAKSILEAWNEGFKNSAGKALPALQDRIDQFNTCFAEDSKKGTTYEIVYAPGEGTSVFVNGVEKAKIPGADFKQAVFGIWLGKVPADKDLRKGMLGG